ncbi:AAA family ATPase [Streptomyces sp. NBC_01511]|uniref:AAA family ATPase n=1 Tax=Streptomyces sp. NBC_01511 TaxID=2903889 RepID=UPI003864398C
MPRVPSSCLVAEGDLSSLAPDRVRVDADEAEEAGRAALASGDADAIGGALETLSREFLPEDRYADWAGERRRRIEVLREQLVPALAGRLLADGRADEAVGVLCDAVDRSPADESLNLLLARTWCDMGRPRQAIRQYHACREALADELGVRPGAGLEEPHRTALSALDALGAAPIARTVPQPAPLPPAIRRPERLPLFGRERPPALLAEHASASAGGTALVVVRGEAGIGKTRLVAEAARRAAARGLCVLWGTSHEAEGQTPYGMFADALDGHLAGCGVQERSRVGAEHVGLAALLPSLGGGPPAAASPEEERARLFRAVAGVLTDLAATRPVLVVLDDVHTADPGSPSLLHHLVRTAQARRWRFIATCRDDTLESDDVRRQVLDVILRQRMAVEIDLPRLSRADRAGLATAAAGLDRRAEGRHTASRILQLSLGNPLFAVELTTSPEADLEHMEPRHRTTAEPDGDAVPDSIRRLIAGRLARLPGDARRTLAALSVAGGTAASLTELEAVASGGLYPRLAAPEVTAALDAAGRLGHRRGTRRRPRRPAGPRLRVPAPPGTAGVRGAAQQGGAAAAPPGVRRHGAAAAARRPHLPYDGGRRRAAPVFLRAAADRARRPAGPGAP